MESNAGTHILVNSTNSAETESKTILESVVTHRVLRSHGLSELVSRHGAETIKTGALTATIHISLHARQRDLRNNTRNDAKNRVAAAAAQVLIVTRREEVV